MQISPVVERISAPSIVKGVSAKFFQDNLNIDNGITIDFVNGVFYTKKQGEPAEFRDNVQSIFTCTGGNQSKYTGPQGYLVASATNTPRIEYDPSTLSVRGLLIELTKTNLCLQSEAFNTTWTTGNATISTNAVVSPDGSTTADKAQEDNVNASHRVIQAFTKAASSITYSYSIWAKAAERSWIMLELSDGTNGQRTWFNLSSGTVGSTVAVGAGFTSVGTKIEGFLNSWYRCSIIVTTNTATALNATNFISTGDTTVSYTGTTGSGIYLWGAQLEVGAFPSSYIPTTTGSIARTTDTCTRTLGTEFSSTAGTVYVDFKTHNNQTSTFATATVTDDGSTNNRIFIFRNNTGGKTHGVTTATVGVLSATANGNTGSTFQKSLIAWRANDFIAYVGGSLAGSSTSGGVPTVTTMRLGCTSYGTDYLDGHIRQFRYWPERKPTFYLQQGSA